MKYAIVSLWVGYRGDSVWIGGGTEWPDDHPIVAAHPDWFTDTPPGGEPAKPKQRARQYGPRKRAGDG